MLGSIYTKNGKATPQGVVFLIHGWIAIHAALAVLGESHFETLQGIQLELMLGQPAG